MFQVAKLRKNLLKFSNLSKNLLKLLRFLQFCKNYKQLLNWKDFF